MKLHLVLKTKWYDMIEADIKGDEYRSKTPYWKKRIWDRRDDFESVVFHRAYTNITMERELLSVKEGTGNPEWGYEPSLGEVYVLELGKRIG